MIAPTAVFDRHTSPSGILDLAARTRQLDGTLPFVHVVQLDGTWAPRSLLPDGAVIRRSVTTPRSVTVLAALGDDAEVKIECVANRTVVEVAATTDERAAGIAESLRDAQAPMTDDCIGVRVWSGGRSTPDWEDRTIEAPRWVEIAQNYPPAPRRSLDLLNQMGDPGRSGRLILWHGEPGTGKTTALRALMRSWKRWCRPQYITDPERFFADPAYLSAVLTTTLPSGSGPSLDRTADAGSPWRLVIAEDADEYLRTSARRDSGSALGRLLNLTDGILGQGSNVIVLLTTNEPLTRLHPAIVRPGRCLAEVEFPAFEADEAARWLGDEVGTRRTLAELVHARDDLQLVSSTARADAIGQYL